MPDFLIGAICGAVGAAIGLIIIVVSRQQKFNNIKKSITDTGVEYLAPFFYCSANRYQKTLKVFDSYGVLYLIGNTVYYKTNPTAAPWAFNLAECKLQQEQNWRRLKWFSFTTSTGDKYYFDSYKMQLFGNNSEETIKALNLFQSKQMSQPSHMPPPLPPKAS